MRSVLLCFLLVFGLLTPIFGQQPKSITNSIGMKLVLIHAGSFSMGSPDDEIGRLHNETSHEVMLSKSFYLGICEVTQGEYEKVMGTNPSKFEGPKKPVDTVSWEDADSFCKKLSDMSDEKSAARVYRLPTEAEWEYACRAGGTTSYNFGDTAESLGAFAWIRTNAGKETHQVGEKKANRWGLYDMHGNVWEWCQDWYADYPPGASTDPQGPIGGESRVARGGNWSSDAAGCRSAFRSTGVPPYRTYNNGLRIALSPTVK